MDRVEEARRDVRIDDPGRSRRQQPPQVPHREIALEGRIAVDHVAMMATTNSAHDCCAKTSDKPIEKANLAGDCAGIGCFMAAPALLPIEPVIAFVTDRAPETPFLAIDLTGRAPPPLLEPPRA